jgi:translation initiation factor 2 beta subunit (eIF-2beta)/eIF-5
MAKNELEKLELVRLESLFSIYNPENAAASQEKLQFWRKMIDLELGNSFTLNPYGLDQKFIINGLFPLCLNEILSEMVKEGDLVARDKRSILQSIISYLSAPEELTKSSKLLVSTTSLERFMAAVLSSLPSDEPIDSDQFSKLLDKTGLTKSDHEYLITHMITSKKINTLNNNHIIIFSKQSLKISEEDLGKSILKRSIRSLRSQTNNFEEKISTLKSSIKQALSAKQKPKALTLLKHQKLIEKEVVSNEEKLFNLEELLQKITSAQDNVELIKTFQTGSAVLKVVLGKKEMVNAQETMDDVFDMLEECGQVQDVISGGGIEIDEDEMAMELEKLIESERGVDELSKQLEGLQTVTTPLPDVDAAGILKEDIPAEKKIALAE